MKSSENIYIETLTTKQFQYLSKFIYEQVGIKMPMTKKAMLEGRLRKRLKSLRYNTFNEYLDFLFSEHGFKDELVHMIDVITTNKTDFFREPGHFDFLLTKALPQLITNFGAGINRTLMIWSAGCSSGEEPYTLAIILSEFRKKYPGLNCDYNILATDISSKVLNMAERGVYDEERIADIPLQLRKKYLMKSKDVTQRKIRIIPELRAHVKFRRLNFLHDKFNFREKMDIIFFRNVLIYFDKPTQEKILKKIIVHLRQGGYIFMGHSETLRDIHLPLKHEGPSVYKKI